MLDNLPQQQVLSWVLLLDFVLWNKGVVRVDSNVVAKSFFLDLQNFCEELSSYEKIANLDCLKIFLLYATNRLKSWTGEECEISFRELHLEEVQDFRYELNDLLP